MFAIFGLGIQEILVLAILGLMMVGLVVFVVFAVNKKPPSGPGPG